MNIVNYNVIGFEFDYIEQTKERDFYLTDLIYQVIRDRDVYLFDANPSDISFIYELSTDIDYQYDSKNKKYVYTTKPMTLDKETILTIVEDQFFYLGHYAIVLSDLTNNENVLRLIASWKDERVLSGIEMIRMDYDGLYLFFYNMDNDLRLKKLLDQPLE